jgi:hypothetical protein
MTAGRVRVDGELATHRVVFDLLIGAFVHGSGYERLATSNCSDRTMRCRRDEGPRPGTGPRCCGFV